LFKLLP